MVPCGSALLRSTPQCIIQVQRNVSSGAFHLFPYWVVESLIGALDSEDEKARTRAVLSLGQIGDERAVRPLTEALEDEGEVVSYNASLALNNFGVKFAEWR